MTKRDLLASFVGAYPAQPATAFWRAVEIDALAQRGLPEGRGLDLGCGDGILTQILLDRAGKRRLVGVDSDPEETRVASRFPFYEAVHTCSGDAIPEPDASFDFVLSNSVLEHIQDLEATIAEVRRLLRPEGRFLFTVPGPGFHANLRGSVFPHVNRQRYLAKLDRRLAHHHYLSKLDWTRLCSRHGLEVDSVVGYLDKHETRRWESLSRATGGLLYTVFGEKSRPIEIQRKVGVRQMQNRRRLPTSIARPLAWIVGAGMPLRHTEWLDPDIGSCCLVEGRRA